MKNFTGQEAERLLLHLHAAPAPACGRTASAARFLRASSSEIEDAVGAVQEFVDPAKRMHDGS